MERKKRKAKGERGKSKGFGLQGDRQTFQHPRKIPHKAPGHTRHAARDAEAQLADHDVDGRGRGVGDAGEGEGHGCVPLR